MKKKMFNLLAIILVLVLSFSLTGCTSCVTGIFSLGRGLKEQLESQIEDEIGDMSDSDIFSQEELNKALEEAGALSGDITISMIWDTYDDLDLHVITPNGNEIYYYNTYADGGELDVDMQASDYDLVERPVENVYFEEPISGTYNVFVVNYWDRTEGYPSQYLVRITVGDKTWNYEGSIEGTDTELFIASFEY